jgi:hypothetical protein
VLFFFLYLQPPACLFFGFFTWWCYSIISD